MSLAERLLARAPELEQEILLRAHGVSDPNAVEDPEYLEGLRAAVAAGVRFGISALKAEDAEGPPLPPPLLAQARSAARSGVSLDTVLRRYFAGYTLLGDFVLREAQEAEGITPEELRGLSRRQAMLFDRVVETITQEYERECAARLPSTEQQRRAALVRRLLAGELADASTLGYDLDGWHIGLAARGPGAPGVIRGLAGTLGRRLLLVHDGPEATWAWLGSGRRAGAGEVLALAASGLAAGIWLAVGEPGQGIGGWRLTHRQALAALQVARRGATPLARYRHSALLAAALQDEVLTASLLEIYIAPLQERGNTEALLKTLDTYLAGGSCISSAAAALGVSRQTVRSRLQTVEEALGQSLDECLASLQTALRLNELDRLYQPGPR